MTLVLVFQIATALGCALMGGLFFAFSSFVMTALARILPEKGIGAMQSINAAVVNPWFFAAFFGTPIACVIVAVLAVTGLHEPGALCALAGSVLYIVGTFLVTMVFNVPLNNALATAAPDSTEGAALWARYVREWTNWNHVRTIAALAAAALMIAGLDQPAFIAWSTDQW
jgi:uncharacterized membrane protein